MNTTANSAPDESALTAEVAIVGGGLAGLTLACALGTAGVPVIVIDRDPPESQMAEAFDGRTTAIAYGSARVLDGAGLWADCVDEAGPILDIRVTDQNSPLFLHYDHRDVGDAPFGWIVENRTIRRALFKRLKELAGTVTHLAPVAVTALDRAESGVALTLADGRTVRSRLVVGADGKRSLCREDAGIRTTGWSYNQHAIITNIEHEEPHGGVAVELFLPAGPFAMLPLTGNRISIVWTERSEMVPWYMKQDEARFTAELQRRVGDWLGRIRPVGPRACYPLGLMHAERYTDRRLALISEASHTMHPIAGQGLNVGIRDVAALAEVVVDAVRVGLDPGAADVLDRYQRWRRVDTMTLLATTDLLTRLFSNNIAPLAMARRLGMAAIDRLPPFRPVKRFFMRHAMGVVGDLPRMVKGEAL
ncbi:UbiH/UbiF/VisC/COQ6 family ubiquinone biosynthesis hydroxylase [Indioceanicola profundi]|uniref:UbiH/UbiF/VisC/COQ6 family ubiquinone biosynthesis hydroxylase n=1 Tax=Indioceanicola profundi TaxID=2220096 RepID=UPI000E6ACEED|nr:UbiH/UbiF/VisC/COQ6 family ubiquinone biosynthesis hydroxylase [Indioceanicola profundi]